MPLYCYVITYDEWEDSEVCPIFHEKKYTEKEFHKLCKEAYEHEKYVSKLNPKHVYAYATKVADYLVKNYGFRLLEEKLITFNTNDVKTGTRRDDDEGNWF